MQNEKKRKERRKKKSIRSANQIKEMEIHFNISRTIPHQKHSNDCNLLYLCQTCK